MNYRHIYHAGNFADVVKHIILLELLTNLLKKPKPFGVLDAFAGTGFYDLSDDRAQVTSEFSGGILALSRNADSAKTPELIKNYLKIVRLFLADGQGAYPGSPAIIIDQLRSSDRLIVNELHKEDFEVLKYNFKDNLNINIHNIDAYLALKSFTPLTEGRGLIFIDPPFEVKDEFDRIIEALKRLYKHARNHMIMIWFPIKNDQAVHNFYNLVKSVGFKEGFSFEFGLPQKETGLNKVGVIVINPSFLLREKIEESLEFLKKEVYLNLAHWKTTILN